MLRSSPRVLRSSASSGIFEANIRPSIKVYHLQEYAKYRTGHLSQSVDKDASTACGQTRAGSAADIALYRKIDNWRVLVAEVDACVRELSPAQLLATAIAYWRLGRVNRSAWKRLCSAAARNAYSPHANITGISSSEVAMILCCYARVYTQQLPSSFSLLKWIVRDVGRLNERDVCMVLFYMRRMRCVPENLESPDAQLYAGMLRAIVLGLAAEGGNKLKKFSPGGLACLVSNLTYIGHIPWSLVYHACNRIRKNASLLDAKTMALHVRSLAMLKFPDKGTLELFASLVGRMRKLDTVTITCFLHSYARLRYRPRCNFASLLDQVYKGIFMFKDHEVAQITFALGQLGYRCPEVFESIFAFVENRISYQNPQNISMFMQGFSKVGFYRPEVVKLLLNEALNTISGFTLSQSVSLLDACAVLGHFDGNVYHALLLAVTKNSELTQDNLSEGIINQLNRIMHCLRLEYPHFIVTAPPPMQTLVNMYQGHYLAAAASEPRRYVYDSIEELGLAYERSAIIGPYRVDALFSDRRALDLLSESSLCPITREPLGSVRLKSRHLTILGYRPVHLILREWSTKDPNGRSRLLQDALSL